MAKQEFFRVEQRADGSEYARKVWDMEDKPARSYENPADKRFRPPSDERQDLAIQYVVGVLGKGIAGLYGLQIPYWVFSTGRKSERCTNQVYAQGAVVECGKSNGWWLTHCQKCGAHIPRRMDMYSSIKWVGEAGQWMVLLARDVTQTRKLNPRFANLVPPQGYERTDEAWVTFVHTMWVIAPIVYAHLHKINPSEFAIASFKTFQEKKHIQYTSMLIQRYARLVAHMNS